MWARACVLTFLASVACAGDIDWVPSSPECRDAEAQYLSIFVPRERNDLPRNLTGMILEAEAAVKTSCNHTHDWFRGLHTNGTSRIDRLLTSAFDHLRKALPVDPNLLVSCFLHVVVEMLAPPAEAMEPPHNPILEDVTALQLEMPILTFMTPRMWWLRMDPMPSRACSLGRAFTYTGSWFLTCWFVAMLQLVYESQGTNTWASKILNFSGLGAAISSFLYAVVATTCLDGSSRKTNLSSCVIESRQRFNFIWPALITTMYGLGKSLEPEKMDGKVEAFVYNYKSSSQPIRKWQQGDLLARGGKQPSSKSVVTNSALRLPHSLAHFSDYFKFGLLALLGTIGVWLSSCPYQ